MEQEKIISETADSIIYEAQQGSYPSRIIIKALRSGEQDPAKVQQFRNEYEITKDINIKGVRKAYDSLYIDGRPSIVLQYLEGISLKQLIAEQKPDLPDFLRIAIQIADILGQVHEANIIHKDINSKNIILKPDGQAYLIDFGISARIAVKSQQLLNPEQLEGSLAYISPEQTGRMNRAVDYRTDFYSLGITFYEMLNRTLPFITNDPMEMVHSHIAKKPVPLHELNADIPLTISAIVEKLLSKNAEDRYQSTSSLRNDLERCLNELTTTGRIPDFKIAENDFSGRFAIPQKLYGRKEDISALLDSFNSVCSGSSEMVVISGYSGVGKTALVHEIHKPVTEQRAFFLEGKFDQFQRNTPYSCFLQAFNGFIDQLLGESTESLVLWKERIRIALGDNGRVLTDIIPRLELITGKQPDVIQTAASEALNRFNYTFLHFIKCIADSKHPLVLFIDDLQWADSGSLSLIKQLNSDKSIRYMLFIGAYRDNETSPSHPWITTINEIKESNPYIRQIFLRGLELKDVDELVAETLYSSPDSVQKLAGTIYKKTEGNPFFTNEFLKSLHDTGLIKWDQSQNQWKWKEDEVNALDVTDNVVHFLTGKIMQLPDETIRLLQYASCLGSRFNTAMLAEVTEEDNDLTNTLFPALEAGFIIPFAIDNQAQGKNGKQTPFDITYKFSHDRVQQAIYSSIDDLDKKKIHLKIGTYLLESPDRANKVFQLADHLNKAVELLNSNQIHELVRINYEAGKLAKKSNAHEASFTYLKNCLSLAGDQYWSTEFEMMFDACLEAGEEEFINHQESASEQILDDAFGKARNDIEKALALRKKIMLYVHMGQHQNALTTGAKALRYMGISMPLKGTAKKAGIAFQLVKALITMRNKSQTDILNLQTITGEKAKTITELYGFLYNALYYIDPELYIFMALYMVNFSLKNGNSDVSPISYVSLGIVNAALLQNYKKADELYKISVALNKKYENRVVRGRLMLNYTGGIQHWLYPAYDIFDSLYECYKVSLENGDITYAGDTVNVLFSKQLFCGKNLPALKEEFEAYRSFINRINDHNQKSDFSSHHHFVDMLMAEKEEKDAILAYEEHFLSTNTNAFTLGYYYVYQSQYHYIMGDFGRSNELAEKGMKLRQGYAASILEHQAVLMDALSLSAAYVSGTSTTKGKVLSVLGKRAKQFKKWADNCEANFGHGYALIQAEIARIKDNPDAHKHYKSAIENARKNRYIQIEAIANERFASYLDNKGLEESSNLHYKEAANLYGNWGAIVKINLLKKRFPGLNLGPKGISLSLEQSLYHSRTNSSDILDMMTVLKASTAISSEIKINHLLERLLKILIENAGAQKAVFIVISGDKFQYKSSEGDNSGLLADLPEILDDIVPFSLAQYVNRSQETIVMEDATSDKRFNSDPYIIKNKPKSLLAMPIISQGKVIAGLYLENNLVAGAFGPNRMELLKMISGQIAISLQNALLYENLEQKVEERTREINNQKGEIENQKKLIELEKQKTDDLLLNILPLETAEELKQYGKAKARKYDRATVMFADIIAFTKLAEQLGPEELVAEIDLCFRAFDEILEKYNIEKIKTIGDAYMCASGINHDSIESAANMILAAMDMQKFMDAMKSGRKGTNEPVFEIRIGISTGPIVAGVVGSKKFAYDIWGDTVNMAARMEQSGQAEKVNISGSTYDLIKDRFECTFRGIVEAKNKGGVEMYFVEREIKEPIAQMAE